MATDVAQVTPETPDEQSAKSRRGNSPQAGILNRPPDHLLVGVFAFAGTDAAVNHETIEALREVLRRELGSDVDELAPEAPKDQPTSETGELGFVDKFDRYHLTVTVGFSASAYDKLGVAAGDRPQDLIPIPWSALGDTPDQAEQGDLAIMACGDSIYVLEHAIHRIEHALAGRLLLLWTQAGAQRHTSRAGRTNRSEGRALIGFLDGTSNLDPRNNAADRGLVFVDPDAVPNYPPLEQPQPGQYGQPQPAVFPPDLRTPPTSEPEWTREGSYMVIRSSTIDMARWDVVALGEQERTIGRFKLSGSGLQAANDPQQPPVEPEFPDADGSTTPLAAHVRKANPRGPNDAQRRIFRRGYPLIAAQTTGIARGLVFVCFGRTISTQFEFITRAWTANADFPHPGAGQDALRSFEHVIAGGYYFVPPLDHVTRPWSWIVPNAG